MWCWLLHNVLLFTASKAMNIKPKSVKIVTMAAESIAKSTVRRPPHEVIVSNY